MEVVQVLRMNGGVGESSYAQNSLLQKKVISMAKPIKEEAIRIMHSFFPGATSFTIADLGCSSGPNAFLVIHEFILTIHNIRRELGNQHLPVDFQAYLNDLPGNDFNTIFKFLPNFRKQVNSEIGEGLKHCCAYGAPGSFYERLFHTQSLHFVHSSYSLHYLSQVPDGIGRSNKRNICLSSSCSESVVKAYYQQFQKDFSNFLKYRSEELVRGGCMVLTLLGRKSDDPCSKESLYIWQLLGLALDQMVSEGLIEEEKLHLFNIPTYKPSPAEIENEVKKEGSFVINRLHVLELDWDAVNYASDDVESSGGREKASNGLLKCMRAVTEPMLVDHFGEGLMDEVFRRYGEILDDRMSKERTFFTNVTVSLTKII